MAKKQARRKRRAFAPECKAEVLRLCKVGDRTFGRSRRTSTHAASTPVATLHVHVERSRKRVAQSRRESRA